MLPFQRFIWQIWSSSQVRLAVFSEDCSTPPSPFFAALSVTQIPLDICEWRSVCFPWSKYSHMLTLVASLAESHYYFGNSCMKTQQPNLSPLSLVGDFRAVLPNVCKLRFTFVKQNWVCCLSVGLLLSQVISDVMAGTLPSECQRWSWRTGFWCWPVKAVSPLPNLS